LLGTLWERQTLVWHVLAEKKIENTRVRTESTENTEGRYGLEALWERLENAKLWFGRSFWERQLLSWHGSKEKQGFAQRARRTQRGDMGWKPSGNALRTPIFGLAGLSGNANF